MEKLSLEKIEQQAEKIFGPDYFVGIDKVSFDKVAVKIWNKSSYVFVDEKCWMSLHMASYSSRSGFIKKLNELEDWIRNEIIGENLVN